MKDLLTPGATTTNAGQTSASDGGAPKRLLRLEQAPCEWLDPLRPNAEHVRDRDLYNKVRQLSMSVNSLAPELSASACVDASEHPGAHTQWPEPHPFLSPEHHQALAALAPVQAWLRNGVLRHNAETGQFDAPNALEIDHFRKDTLACTQDLVNSLAPLFKEIEVFLCGLPAWLKTMADAPAQGMEVPLEVATWLESCGVRLTQRRLTPLQWALVLASTAQRLEQRWLAASVAHQMAFMSHLRSELIGALSEALSQKLTAVRHSIEPDDEECLPIELQWIDRARPNVLTHYWPCV